MGFVFYDTETTGTNKTFDQILQFAAIQTDDSLNEIGRFEIRCRIHPHMVPSPGAMRVTGIGVQTLIDPALSSHYEMMREIREKLLSWSPAIFAGYNSMDFDEPLLRQGLYQTLHPPYLTNTNGNCRADVMDMVQCAVFLDTNALVIPNGENGRKSFKLDRLAPANGFNHANAHDALADVEATIHVCRLIMERCPDCWSSFTRFAQKAAVLDYISDEPAFLHIANYFNRPYPFALTLLGVDQEQSSLAYVLDLSVNLPELAELSDNELAKRIGKSPKPVRKLKANAAPFIMDIADAPDEIAQRLPSETIIEQQLVWLEANPEFRTRLLGVVHAGKAVYEPATHIEEKIFDGFLDDADLVILDEFHAAPWTDRYAILERLSDQRSKFLGRRLIYAHDPNALPAEARGELDTEIRKRLLGSSVGNEPWLTIPEALTQTDDLIANAQDDELTLLADLRDYLNEKLDELLA